MVLQDTNLFSGTIMDNIRFGRLDATDEECIEACQIGQLQILSLLVCLKDITRISKEMVLQFLKDRLNFYLLLELQSAVVRL